MEDQKEVLPLSVVENSSIWIINYRRIPGSPKIMSRKPVARELSVEQKLLPEN